jgi:hypothetical protein
LVCGAPEAEKRVVWVARRDEEACLLAARYPKARAIGLPIRYTRPTGLARIPRSLLVMPGHSLVGWKVGDRSAYRRGENAMAHARATLGQSFNSPEATLVAYDLQARSHTSRVRRMRVANDRWFTLASSPIPDVS